MIFLIFTLYKVLGLITDINEHILRKNWFNDSDSKPIKCISICFEQLAKEKGNHEIYLIYFFY